MSTMFFSKFYNVTMVLATIVALCGGFLRSDSLISVSMAMVAAAGTSFQVERKQMQPLQEEISEKVV